MRSVNKLLKLAHIFENKLLSLANNDKFSNDEIDYFTSKLRQISDDLINDQILSAAGLFKAINTIKSQISGTKQSTASVTMPLSRRIERDRQRFSSSLNMIADLIKAKRTGKKRIIELLDYLLNKLSKEKYVTEEESENFGRICKSCGLEKDIVFDNKCQECVNEEIGVSSDQFSRMPRQSFTVKKRTY